MRRHHNESSLVTTTSRIIPISASPQEAQFIDGSTSCLSPKVGSSSSDSVLIAPSSPCGTPPRKRWEGAFNMFLRGKNTHHSPTLSSSQSSSVASTPIVEDLSTGSASSSSGTGGGMKGTKKKSSFSLIPGSRRLVSRNGSHKSNAIPTKFSKGGGNGHHGLFSRGHKSMDALDIPLRKGTEKAKPNAEVSLNEDSASRYLLRRRESPRISPVTTPVPTQPILSSSVPQYSAEGLLRGIGLRRDQPRLDYKATATATATISTTPSIGTSALNDQLRACAISSTLSYGHANPSNPELERSSSADWHTNPIVNEGVELPLATSSAPSLSQLQTRRSHSRTHMYSSNSSTIVHQYQHPHQDELDLRMMPEIPVFREVSNHNRASSSEFHDVGLNLDDSDNSNMDHANQYRQDQLQSHNPNNYNNSNPTTIITDCGIPEPPETLDEILGGIGGLVTVHTSSSSHLMSKMSQQIAASPEMQKCLLLQSDHSDRNPNNYNNSNTTTIITDCGIPEPPESLDEILGGIGGSVTIHTSSSSHLLSKMSQQMGASPETKKIFTKIHNSSEYGQDISPFLGGQKASNLDLAGAHKSCIAAQQSMLLRSVQSNQNISSLMRTQYGSIPRSTNTGFVEGQRIMKSSHNSPSSFLSQSLPLDTFSDQSSTNKDSRLLKPIQRADSWAQGRRYLIAPAALAACPLSTIKSLTGLCTQSATEAAMSMDPPKASGVIELGDAFMTYVGDRYHLTCGKWSACRLVLRQNYLFEYDLSAPLNSLPRGIALLQHAVAHTQHDYQDALELCFYASPCAKVDQRVLLIRVKNKDERDHWITCLNKAARLGIEDIWEYKKDRPLGTGRYASIFPARRKMPRSINGEEEHRCDQERLEHDNGVNNCALKIIDKNEFWRLVVKGRERCDTIVRELAVQSTLTAKFGTKPTFLQIHGFFETSEKIVIELELLDGKDLFEYISSKGVLEEEEAGFIIRDVLIALNSMSRAGIAHRDIKPANILMTKCDECKYGTAVKLGDFGMSTLVGVDDLIRGRCGSPGYVAPEILKADAGEGYRNQVDIFSAGVTLYLMLCGYEPFYGETEKELINANKKAHIDFPDSEWSKISPEAKDLVAQMLKTDPRTRITAKEAVEHPWIVRLEQDQKSNSSRHPRSTDDTFRNSELEEGVCAIM